MNGEAPLPIWATIEPTDICNLACPSCTRQEVIVRSDKRPASLTRERLAVIANELPGLVEVKFHGLGEPFLAPNATELFGGIKGAYPELHLVSITNATWPKHVDVAGILEHVDHLYISVDGHERESFESARTNGKFEIMLENARRIMREKPERTIVSINCCFTAENYQNLYQVVILSRALGIDRVRFNLVQNWISNADGEAERAKHAELQLQALANASADDLLKHVKYMRKVAAVMAVRAEIVGNPRFDPRDCQWSSKMTYITQGGEVLPCAMRCDPKHSFGNLFETPFKEIWNGEVMATFRSRRSSGDLPAICRDCPYSANAPVIKRLIEADSGTSSQIDFLMHR